MLTFQPWRSSSDWKRLCVLDPTGPVAKPASSSLAPARGALGTLAALVVAPLVVSRNTPTVL